MTDRLSAPAKINLHLAITGRRADGYHDLSTLFVPVPGLADTLELTPGAPGGGCMVQPALPDTPPEANLVYRAWKAYGTATGFGPDLDVRLLKRIPTGAGLGGGSSDAAAMLRWLQTKAGPAALPPERLNELAAKLGADVPFFLQDAPAWALGIGDELHPAALDLSGLWLAVVLPPVHVSTAWAYAEWDRTNLRETGLQGRPEGLTSAAAAHKKPFSLSPVVVRNDFEAVVFPAHPSLRRLKERLLALGASAAVMSGSGAALAGLYREERLAHAATEALRAEGLTVHLEALK